MSLPVRLHSVPLRALVALPLLLAVFTAEVLLDAREITQRARRVVMNAALLRAHIHSLSRLLAAPLPQLPWEIMPPPVKLKVLVSLKPFPAYLTQEPVCRHQGLWRQGDHLSVRICDHLLLKELYECIQNEETQRTQSKQVPGVPGRLLFFFATGGLGSGLGLI